MTTSNQNYGIQFEQLKHCDLVEKSEQNNDFESDKTSQQHDDDTNHQPKFSFLYTRESDQIGTEVESSNSSLAKAFDKEKPKRKRQLKVIDETVQADSNNAVSVNEAKAILGNYKHEKKVQNPLYSTTSNNIGSKKPSPATFTTMKYSRSQSFSKSFNRIMFQDQGLNTSSTRSNVHERLDSHFV